MSENIFEESTETPVVESLTEGETYLGKLVGEGKKFSDVEGLAKGKLESDQMISFLENQAKELREELQKRSTLDEFMQKLQNQTPPVESNAPPQGEPEIEPKEKGLSPEDIESMLNNKLSELTEQQKQDANLKSSIAVMNQKWGSDAKVKLQEAAAKIGVSVQNLQDYAKTNPSVFLQLVGLNEPVAQQQTSSVPSSTVDTSKLPNSPVGKTYQDFEKIRRENPAEYFTPKVQNELHKLMKDYAEKGIDFTTT